MTFFFEPRKGGRPFIEDQALVFLKNTHGTTMPPGGVGRVTGMTSQGNVHIWEVTRPDGTAANFYVVNGPAAIASGGVGAGHAGPIVTAAYDIADGTPSGEWGPQSGSWLLRSAGTGFNIVGVRNLSQGDLVDAVQARPGGTSPFTPHASVCSVRLTQDIQDGETGITFDSAVVLAPKQASSIVPTIDDLRNDRLNCVAGNAERVLIAYDQDQSILTGDEIWYVSGVDSARILLGSMSAASTQVVPAGTAATLAFSLNLFNDPTGFADAAGNRFLTPTRSGWVILKCQIEVSASGGASAALIQTAQATLQPTAAGGSIVRQDVIGSISTAPRFQLMVNQVFQNTGATVHQFTISEILGTNNLSVDAVYAECYLLPVATD